MRSASTFVGGALVGSLLLGTPAKSAVIDTDSYTNETKEGMRVYRASGDPSGDGHTDWIEYVGCRQTESPEFMRCSDTKVWVSYTNGFGNVSFQVYDANELLDHQP